MLFLLQLSIRLSTGACVELGGGDLLNCLTSRCTLSNRQIYQEQVLFLKKNFGVLTSTSRFICCMRRASEYWDQNPMYRTMYLSLESTCMIGWIVTSALPCSSTALVNQSTSAAHTWLSKSNRLSWRKHRIRWCPQLLASRGVVTLPVRHSQNSSTSSTP